MKRWSMANSVAAILTVAAALSAQSPRDGLRKAFESWRQADPDLERDAATSGDLSQRAGSAAAAAAAYDTARAAYLLTAVAEANASMQWLTTSREAPGPGLAPAVEFLKIVSASTEQVTKQIGTYADTIDPALLPVRQALARERSALLALSTAISERQSAVTKSAGTLVAVEQARVKAVEPQEAIVGALQSESSGVEQETLAWAQYYRLLAEGTRAPILAPAPAVPPGVVASAAPSVLPSASPNAANAASDPPSPNAITVGGVRINNPARGAANSAPVETAEVHINNPAVTVAPQPNNPPPQSAVTIPMGRFAGSWMYQMGGLYHGPEPDIATLDIKEDGGKLLGTMNARFWPFGDIKAVTSLRFEFSGVPEAGRILTLPLVTNDGAKGTIELIPGPAYNLLEINYYMDHVAGKLNRGNMILIRR